MAENKKIKTYLLWLIIVSTLIRAFLAATLELGNDEVYYWTYALFPDFSHFDHPPMVGWVIQLFSLNLYFDSELFIRMASIMLGSINILLVYKIGNEIKNPLTGLYASGLFVASLYGSIITGVFILPDTPMIFFWLICLLLMIKFIKLNLNSGLKNTYFIWIGAVIGLAMLSKYNAVFLWLAVVVFLFMYNRKMLLKMPLWIGILLSIMVFTPVIYWNLKFDFISFTYQTERVGFFSRGLTFNYFGTELLGEIIYMNPFVFFLILISLYKLIRNRHFIPRQLSVFLLLSGLPMVGLMLFFSLFRSTLPHWACPGYVSLLFFPAAYLAEKKEIQKLKLIFPNTIMLGLIFTLLVSVLGYFEIKTGIFQTKKITGNDLTLDLFGWKQAGEKFEAIHTRLIDQKRILPDAPLLSWRWFPGANQEYYVGRKIHKNMILVGSLDQIHKYAWTNITKGGLSIGQDAFFLCSEHDFHKPDVLNGVIFDSVIPVDTILIERNHQIADKVHVFLLKNLKSYKKEFVMPELIQSNRKGN